MSRTPRRLTVEDILALPVVSDAQIDPAGQVVAYVVGEAVCDNTKLPKQHIWLADMDGQCPRQFSHGPRADFHPRWSPDGQQIAFLSDRLEDGKLQIYLMDRRGGEAVQLADVEGEIDTSRWKDALQWSPDGQFLAFLMQDPETEEEKKKKEAKDDAQEFEKRHKFTRLWTLELATRQLRQVTRGAVQVWEFQWSPDDREFALIISDFPYEWSWYRSRLARVAARGGVPATIYRPPERQIALPRWSPDQKQIAFISSVWSDRGLVQGDLFVVDRRGGEARDVSPDYPGSIGWMEWIKNGRTLLTAGYEQGQAAFGELDAQTGRVEMLWRERVSLAEDYWPRFSLAKNGRRVCVVRSAPSDARNVWRGDLANARLTWKRLTDAVPHLRQFALGQQEVVKWTSRDGWTIHGVLIKPVGYRRGRRCPLIVNPHGGPSALVANGFLGQNLWGQLLAARGYAIFFPNFRGSTGFGLAFAEANRGDLGGMDFQDMDAGVDALIERGIADPERLGIGGWSYGGFMTCWTITQTDRYKAAVMGAGISNWLSFHGNSHLHTWDANHYNASPYERDGLYAKFSAINYVSRVKTPTLILHGEADHIVPSEQSYQFYRALHDHGVDAELVIYPREGHFIGEKQHWLDRHRRVAAWYDQSLK